MTFPTRRTLAGMSAAANSVCIIPPSRPSLLSWTVFGNASGDNTNEVYGGSSITANGSPTTSAGYATCTETSSVNACYDGGVTLSGPATIIAATRQQLAVGQIFGSSSGHGADGWCLEYNSGGGSVHVNGGMFNFGGGNVGTYTGSQLSTWRIWALTFPNSGSSPQTALYDLTLQSTPLQQWNAFAPATPRNVQFGGGGDNGGTVCQSRLAFAAVWSEALSQSQVNSMLPAIRDQLTRRGITEGT